MSKWFGKIGFTLPTQEVEPGVWDSHVEEREYYGDMTSNRWKRQSSGEINDNLSLANVLSILADPFALENHSYIAYVEILGSKWKVSDVELQYPRMILSIGGVWNGNSPGTAE
jgi:hypothetical protein